MPLPIVFKVAAASGGVVNGLIARWVWLSLAQPPPGQTYEYYAPTPTGGSGVVMIITAVTALLTAVGFGGLLKVWFERRMKKRERDEVEARDELRRLREHNHDIAVWAAGALATARAEGVELSPPPPRPKKSSPPFPSTPDPTTYA